MNFVEQILSSAVVSAALVTSVAWLARTLIYERLKASVQHEFNEKLEVIRTDAKQREALLQAELRAQDSRLQAALRNREQQLQLLQSDVLNARASRQAALETRRLDAIDLLWSSFQGLAPLRLATKMMEPIDFNKALKESATDQKTRAFFSDIAKMAGVSTEQLQARAADTPWKARLYVSDQSWKLFEAYQGVLNVFLLRLKQLEIGIDKDITLIEKSIAEVKEALPHYTDLLDKYGGDVLPILIDDLGKAFELSLLKMLKNEPSSAQDIEEVGSLMAAAEKLIDFNRKSVENSTG